MVARPELRKRVRSAIMAYYRGVLKILSECKEAGLVGRHSNLRVLTGIFIGTINFSAVRWILSDFTIDIEKESDLIWKTLKSCIFLNKPITGIRTAIEGKGGNRS